MNLYQTVPEKYLFFRKKRNNLEIYYIILKTYSLNGPFSNPCEPLYSLCNTARVKSVTVSNDCLTWVDVRDAIATSHVP